MAFVCNSFLFQNYVSPLLTPFIRLGRSYCSKQQELYKGLVLGAYSTKNSTVACNSSDRDLGLSNAAESFNQQTGNRLREVLKLSGDFKKGDVRVFYGLDREFPAVAVVNLGPDPIKDVAYFDEENELEERDTAKENLRDGIAAATKTLRNVGINVMSIDPCSDAESAAESAALSTWLFQDLKDPSKRKREVDLILHATDKNSEKLWENGLIKASGQNLARWLMEMPSNHMTPTIFAQNALELLEMKNTHIEVHDKAWAEKQGMNAFLAVAKGSQEPPLFLEVTYNNSPDKEKPPIVFVGKGITFDAGGISIKSASNMDIMRGDMGGAACTLATIRSAEMLNLPLYIKGFIPLCENMPSGTATKPGDVVTALNGKTIQIDDTDAEGRLVLADALVYAQQLYKPNIVIDIATLTGEIITALSGSAAGVYTNSNTAWKLLQQSGYTTGDRVWRMPLWKYYDKAIESHLADLNNIPKSSDGGSCTAAAFLKNFVQVPHWIHLDIAGVAGMVSAIETGSYIGKGMSGRPTRTLIEFLSRMEKSVL